MKIISKIMFTLVLATGISSGSTAFATPIVIGDTAFGGGVDGWRSIMVIGENDGYTNTTGNTQQFDVTSFDFRVGANRGRVTPFVVKVNNAATNDFTILAIGDTRSSGVDYNSTGDYSFDFSSIIQTITVDAGVLIAPGFLDADKDGNSSGSVIPFFGGDSVFLTGHPSDAGSGSLSNGIGGAPTFGNFTFNNGLSRNYSFNITLDELVANVPEPSALAFLGLGLVGMRLSRNKKSNTGLR